MKQFFAVLVLIFTLAHNAHAAQGEMGTGIPVYGLQGSGLGYVTVFRLEEATRPFPPGCTYLVIAAFVVGGNMFQPMLATLLAAKTARKKIRFYAVQPSEGGCGVDYIEVVD